jgi:hypothetical protein
MKVRILAVLATLALILLPASAAHAAGSCSVSPDPVTIGVDYTVNGAGLTPNDDYELHLQQTGNHAISIDALAYTDASGAFAQTFDWISARGQWDVGTVDVSVYERDASQNKGYQHGPKVAGCSFEVVA